MEINPGEVPINLMVKVLFRLGKQLWRDGFDLNGEASVDIQALQETVFLHEVEVIASLLKHGRLEVGLGESVDELHLVQVVGDDAPRVDGQDDVKIERIVVDVGGIGFEQLHVEDGVARVAFHRVGGGVAHQAAATDGRHTGLLAVMNLMQTQRAADVASRLLCKFLKEMEIRTPSAFGPVAVDLNFVLGNVCRSHDVLNGKSDIARQPIYHGVVHIIQKSLVRDEHHGNHRGAVVGELALTKALNRPNRDGPTAFNVYVEQTYKQPFAPKLVEIVTLRLPYRTLRLPVIEVHVVAALGGAGAEQKSAKGYDQEQALHIIHP